jgi:steroid 5-alpha reductase family enzyme
MQHCTLEAAMFELDSRLAGLTVMVLAAIITWAISVLKRNVAIVDVLWSLMFLLGAITYVNTSDAGPRTQLVLVLVALWSLRLAIYIGARNWGHPEDRRYQAIRARNEPGFAFKSLYLVFILQALLAWVVSMPLSGAIASVMPLNALDYAGVALFAAGFLFEAIGDWQLSRFKADAANKGRVMDRGLWRYTRHPNYFGEFCVWWGFFLLAAGGGAWWTAPGPILISFLLLRVSGVSLLEKDIGERRPGYAEYIRRTNAFFPGPRRA